jgi:hypothetical protein
MPKSSPEWNKALVLEAFDSLFNKREEMQNRHRGRAEFPKICWLFLGAICCVISCAAMPKAEEHSGQFPNWGRHAIFRHVREISPTVRC